MTDARPRILIADDNVQLLGLMRSILESAGYDVTVCEDGGQVIEWARTQVFDILVLDALMPNVDGFEACEAIRAEGPNRETPVVFLTGMAEDATYEDAVEVGADEVLSKPLNRSSLLLRLRSLRRLSEARRERDRRASELDAVRAALEGLASAARSAGPTGFSVRLEADADGVLCTVRHDGSADTAGATVDLARALAAVDGASVRSSDTGDASAFVVTPPPDA